MYLNTFYANFSFCVDKQGKRKRRKINAVVLIVQIRNTKQQIQIAYELYTVVVKTALYVAYCR